MVVGHPFKGGNNVSVGQLQHPDMKRFELADSSFFMPPRPAAWAQNLAAGMMAAPEVPEFGHFFASYFGGRSMNVTNPKCASMLEGMKKCWENNAAANPSNQCAYYIQGFERLACNNN